jgi:clan AA aspartic protease
MGLVYENITLKNGGDVINVRRGIIGEAEIRQKEVLAIVDTGTEMLVINEAMRQELGLEIRGRQPVRMANDFSDVCHITDAVEIHWKDRSFITQAVVLEGTSEILLGAIPLEGMNLMVDPANQKLVGVHGDRMIFRV